MARKVTRDDINKWLELRRMGHTFKRIGEETGGWDEDTVRKYIDKEQVAQKEEKHEMGADLEMEAKAFSELEKGKNPADLVMGGICSADIAKGLMEKYTMLKNMSRPELEILEARMENASHLVRCALGIANMKIICPLCHEEGELVLIKIDGVDRWVCNSCGNIPF